MDDLESLPQHLRDEMPDDFAAHRVQAWADARVAAERERWATAARLAVEATPEQLPLALDALRDVLRA